MSATATAATNDNAQSIVNINGYALCNQWEDGIERIRDEELAKRLGYKRVRDIRKLIERMQREGKLNNLHQCATVALRADGMPSKPATVYWLSEPQALKVIAKSETATADKILDEVVAVFVMWRRGGLAPANMNAIDKATLAALENLGKRVSFIETYLATEGIISRSRLHELQTTVRNIAKLEHDAGRWQCRRAASSDVYRELREAVGWGLTGQPWKLLPAALQHPVFVTLRRREAVIVRELGIYARDRQTKLKLGDN